MENLKLAQYLSLKRERVGIRQKEVADQLGYKTSQFVSNWERGHSVPPLNALKKIFKMYKIKLDELFEHVLNASIYLSEQTI